jgi:hypothetical protein
MLTRRVDELEGDVLLHHFRRDGHLVDNVLDLGVRGQTRTRPAPKKQKKRRWLGRRERRVWIGSYASPLLERVAG